MSPPPLPRRPTSSPITSSMLVESGAAVRFEMRGQRVCGIGSIYVKQDTAEGGGEQGDRLATEIDERLDCAALA